MSEIISGSSNSSRSIVADGQRLKSLRALVGLTQAELSGAVDMSDRVIRKAESGESVDLRTMRALHQFFVDEGHAVEFADLLQPTGRADGIALLNEWLAAVHVDQDFVGAAALVSADAVVRIEGVSVNQTDIVAELKKRAGVTQVKSFEVEHQFGDGQHFVAQWTANLSTANDQSVKEKQGKDTKLNQHDSTCGINLVRVEGSQIISINELSSLSRRQPGGIEL